MVTTLCTTLACTTSTMGLTCKTMRFEFSRTLAILTTCAPTTVPKLAVNYVLTGLKDPCNVASVVYNSTTALLTTMFACLAEGIGMGKLPLLTPIFSMIFGTIVIKTRVTMFLPRNFAFGNFLVRTTFMNLNRLIMYCTTKVPLYTTVGGAKLHGCLGWLLCVRADCQFIVGWSRWQRLLFLELFFYTSVSTKGKEQYRGNGGGDNEQ